MTLQININAVIIIESQFYLNSVIKEDYNHAPRGVRYSLDCASVQESFFFTSFIYLYSFVRKHFVESEDSVLVESVFCFTV